MNEIAGIVLAAGIGKRMRSRLPKPLHKVCGKELVRYPVELLRECGIAPVFVVVSPTNGEQIRGVLGGAVEYVTQAEPKGTGDALEYCRDVTGTGAAHVVVIGGDTPLVRKESLQRLIEGREGRQMGLLTGHDPALRDLGIVARKDGLVAGIVEAAESTWDDQYSELNAGIYCFESTWLWNSVSRVSLQPSGERYLTELAAIAAQEGSRVETVAVADASELLGVNDRLQLANAEAAQRERVRHHWMTQGVTMTDPASVFIDADAALGMDTVILPNTMVLGRSTIGEDCEIGPGSVIRDTSVGDSCRVTASVLEGSVLESGSDIGPYSHLRPGAYIESGVHIGNFVEVKESRIGEGVAIGHFSYVGDASIGARTNIGAGMVTCNYDGQDKHRTIIGEDAFIGCDTMLVAPVTVGARSVTGAGQWSRKTSLLLDWRSESLLLLNAS